MSDSSEVDSDANNTKTTRARTFSTQKKLMVSQLFADQGFLDKLRTEINR